MPCFGILRHCRSGVLRPAEGCWRSAADGDILVIETKHGKVLVKLRPDLAPKHVERVKTLAKEGFYDGQKFHRVIGGFMAQTGDPPAPASAARTIRTCRRSFRRSPSSAAPSARHVPPTRTPPTVSSSSASTTRLHRPQRPVHGVGPGDRRHGARRPGRQGRAAADPRRDGEGLPAVGCQVAAPP